MAGSITSLSADGTLAAAAGAASFVTLSHTLATQPGVYRVRVWAGISGTIGAADQDNMKLVVGATSQKLAVPGTDGYWGPFDFMLNLDGSTDVVLASIATSVGAYTGLIVADFLGRNGQLAKYFPA
jgi:hypothetical protein